MMALDRDKKNRKVAKLHIFVQILLLIALMFTSENTIEAKSLTVNSQEQIKLSETENAQIKEYLVDDKENNLSG